MKGSHLRHGMMVLLPLFFWACLQEKFIQPPEIVTGSADFSRFMAIGDGFVAGITDGVMIDYGQQFSIPNLIAQQVGIADFRQPMMADPGFGQDPLTGQPIGKFLLLNIHPLQVNTISLNQSPYDLLRVPPADSAPTYDNLAVPFHSIRDVRFANSRFFNLTNFVLREQGSQFDQAMQAKPSFVLLWAGFSDLVGLAITGRVIEGFTITPPDSFRKHLTAIVRGFREQGAQMVMATIPDMSQFPLLTAIPPVLVDLNTLQPVLADSSDPTSVIYLQGEWSDGSIRTLSDDPNSDNFALLNLRAKDLLKQGYGYSVERGGNGLALSTRVVIDKEEYRIFQARLATLNQIIFDVASQFGVAVADIHDFIRDIHESGVRVGGIQLNTRYITGGFFSLDGIHPTPAGYALIANEFIKTVNAFYSADIPLVDVSAALFASRRTP